MVRGLVGVYALCFVTMHHLSSTGQLEWYRKEIKRGEKETGEAYTSFELLAYQPFAKGAKGSKNVQIYTARQQLLLQDNKTGCNALPNVGAMLPF